MTNITEIVRYRHVRLQGGFIVAGVVGLTYGLWQFREDWPWLLPCGVLLGFLGVLGLTMVIRRPQAALWIEGEALHWHEDSFLPFQRARKGAIPMSEITHVRHMRTALTESFLFELVIVAGGKHHLMPPNIGSLTHGKKLADLLAALHTLQPAITFDEVHGNSDASPEGGAAEEPGRRSP